VDSYQEAGHKSVTWDGSNLSSGVYFYRLTVEGLHQVRRMILLR